MIALLQSGLASYPDLPLMLAGGMKLSLASFQPCSLFCMEKPHSYCLHLLTCGGVIHVNEGEENVVLINYVMVVVVHM